MSDQSRYELKREKIWALASEYVDGHFAERPGLPTLAQLIIAMLPKEDQDATRKTLRLVMEMAFTAGYARGEYSEIEKVIDDLEAKFPQ